MGRNLEWLYRHATRLKRELDVEQYLRDLDPSHAVPEQFAEDWRFQIAHDIRDWKRDTVAKLEDCGAGTDTTAENGRTPMALMLPLDFDEACRRCGGRYARCKLAEAAMLAALYDVTVVEEGRRLTALGHFGTQDDPWSNRRCRIHRGDGSLLEIDNPYFRPEALRNGPMPKFDVTDKKGINWTEVVDWP